MPDGFAIDWAWCYQNVFNDPYINLLLGKCAGICYVLKTRRPSHGRREVCKF